MTRRARADIVRRRLEQRGVAFARWVVADSVEATLAGARTIGFPVVAKVVSDAVVHKSDAGLVVVAIGDEVELRRVLAEMSAKVEVAAGHGVPFEFLVEEMVAGEVELLVGVRRDATFGAAVAVGLGGTAVEIHADVSLRILPVTVDDVRSMLTELRSFPLLDGYRNRCPVDVDAFVEVVLAVAECAAADERVVELELNPVVVRCVGGGAVAVDARMILDNAEEGWQR